MKLIIFDFDGVFVNTLPIAYAINTEVNDDLSLEEYRSFYEGNIHQALRSDGLKKNYHPEFAARYQDLARELTIPDALKECVKNLSENYILTIVSSTTTDPIEQILSREGVREYFKDILGGDVAASKVKKITMLLEKYKSDPVKTVFITDTLGDIKEAHACSVPVVAVTWGFHSRETLLKGNPEKIIDQPSDLEQIILRVLQ